MQSKSLRDIYEAKYDKITPLLKKCLMLQMTQSYNYTY